MSNLFKEYKTMKKFFKYMIPSLAAVLLLGSCKDDDASAPGFVELPCTVSMENLTAASYNLLNADVVLSNPENVLEQGLELSATEDFAETTIIVADSVNANVKVNAAAAPGNNYYVRAYAFLKNNQVLRSATQTVSTPEYTYPVNGTYHVSKIFAMDWDDYNFYDVTGTADYPVYDVTIELSEEEEGEVIISNILGAGLTVQGIYDEEEGVILVPSGQVCTEDLAGYGPAQFIAFNEELDGEEYVTFTFDKKTGSLSSSIFGIRVTAGFWDILYIQAAQ